MVAVKVAHGYVPSRWLGTRILSSLSDHGVVGGGAVCRAVWWKVGIACMRGKIARSVAVAVVGVRNFIFFSFFVNGGIFEDEGREGGRDG